MSYFTTIKYDNKVEGAIHFENFITNNNEMFLIVQFFKLNPDKTKKSLACSQAFNAETIDDLIEQLQRAKQNIVKFNNGEEISYNKQDNINEIKFRQFKDRFDKQVKASGLFNFI